MCVWVSSIVFKTLVDILFFFFYNIFHLDVHYVCMLVQRFQPQGRRFTNFHYYYYKYNAKLNMSHDKIITLFASISV